MTIPDTDLLPPIFDQVVLHFGGNVTGPEIRADLVDALVQAIVNAAADVYMEKSRETCGDLPDKYEPTLISSDRLSGANLSRARLVERMHAVAPSLSPMTLEIALLLIESQIDLRLRPGKGFEFQNITFTLDDKEAEEPASWCQNILGSALLGITGDRTTIWSRLSRNRPEGIRILVEGLQLSSTLRRAIPYTINVAQFLIDPLIKGEGNYSGIRVVHISDLHLTEEIFEQGRRLLRPAGVATHNFDALRAFAWTMQGLKPRRNLILITGDITTDGARGSFETAKKYIEKGSIKEDNPGRIATFALSAGIGDRLLLPGNHDRYDKKDWLVAQTKSMLFEEVFKTRTDYPYVVGYRPPHLVKVQDSLTLLLFVFDSNLPEIPARADPHAAAGGKVTPEDMQKVENFVNQITNDNKVKDLNGQDLPINLQKTVRIAVLHHHPVVSKKEEKEKDLWYKLTHLWDQPKASFTKMEQADDFLRGCFQLGIQLVLFGHQHEQYHRLVTLRAPPDKSKDEIKISMIKTPFGDMAAAIHAFCCASTLEYTVCRKGFYTFDFPDEKSVTMSCFVSEKDSKGKSGPFNRDDSRTFNLSNPDMEESDIKWL